MKQYIRIYTAVLIFLAMLLPATVSAETYNLNETDISINLDDSAWYVFTRDNIKNNPELEELEISYDSMYDILYNNQAYMDAILAYEDGEYIEFFVRKTATDSGIANLSNYNIDEVTAFASELAKKQGTEDYTVYENQYKFAKSEYIDKDFYLCEFVTIVNKEIYTLTFQSTIKYSAQEYDEISNIIDSIRFDVDASLKEPKTSSLWDSVITKAIGGAVIGGIVGLIIALVNKRKTSKKNNENY